MRVVSTSKLPAIAREVLAGFVLVESNWKPSRTREEMVGLLCDAEAVISLLGDKIDEPLFERCPTLKIVSNFAVGHDNVDVVAATERGIWVTNTPGVLTDATADLTLALILAVTRRIVEGHERMVGDRYEGWHPLDHLGVGLGGKVLGIVGFGRIGRAVASRARAFGMNVIFASRSTAEGDGAVIRVEMDELLRSSDIVTIHCPLTAETHHLFDANRLGRMKKGSFLINTARGAIVDESALVDHLESRHLAGAGLDVFENEPHAHPALRTRRDVVLLPHIGSATTETRSEMARLAATNVAAVLRGEVPPYAVNDPRRER